MTTKNTKIPSSGDFLRVLYLLVGSLLSIQAIHYFYTSGLRDKPLLQTGLSGTPKVVELNISLSIERKSEYYVYHVMRDPTIPQPVVDSVTYVTHCSSHNLRYLPSLVKRWNGPISLAIITSSEDFQSTLSVINSFYMCRPKIKEHVSFHVVFQDNHVSAIFTTNAKYGFDVPCNQLKMFLFENLKGRNYLLKGMPYPGNVLRNVAISQSKTNFVLVTDIDLLPSSGLYQQSVEFFKGNGSNEILKKTAFVLPAFEVEEFHSLPMDKEDLANAVSVGYVRQFHKDVCRHCHRLCDYIRWFNLRGTDHNLRVAYPVEYERLSEPYTITPKSAPLYDERFKQYGFNRVSYVCHLHIHGFSFAVLDPAFLVHRGFKKKHAFHESRKEEINVNAKLFNHFVTELKAKYPLSDRKCF